MKNILTPLFITALVSIVFGWVMFLLIGTFRSFIGGAISAFLVQFFISYLFNGFIAFKQETANDEIIKSYIEMNTKQQVTLSCAFCRTKNVIDININEDNLFDCKQCNQSNIVLMEFSTARTSKTIDGTNKENVLNRLNEITKADGQSPVSVNIKDHATPIEIQG